MRLVPKLHDKSRFKVIVFYYIHKYTNYLIYIYVYVYVYAYIYVCMYIYIYIYIIAFCQKTNRLLHFVVGGTTFYTKHLRINLQIKSNLSKQYNQLAFISHFVLVRVHADMLDLLNDKSQP